jgi:hypothetical protein
MDKSERAATLLDDEFFKEVIADLKNSEINAIINSNETDCDLRESSYKTIRTLDLLVSHIQSIADSSKIKEKRWKIL